MGDYTQRFRDTLPSSGNSGEWTCFRENNADDKGLSNSLYAEPSMLRYIRENFNYKNAVIVSPDAGGAKRYYLLPLASLMKLLVNIHIVLLLLPTASTSISL